MANVHLTAAAPGTAVELPPDDAARLADELDRLERAAFPGARDTAARIRAAIADPADHEVALEEAELDALAHALSTGERSSEQLSDLADALGSWR
jgi:hypothetical protein